MDAERTADAVVAAAGSSLRMGGRDKLDEDLDGRSVLRWAVEGMAASPAVDRVIVVVPEGRVEELSRAAWLQRLSARVVAGGSRRQESVALGVREAAAPIVLVHDGARPFVTPALVSRVTEAARRHGAAIPVLPQADALKRLEGDRVGEGVDRRGLASVQTPQGARLDLLGAALERHAFGPAVLVDEAQVLERDGAPVVAVDGDPANIKVTRPADLELARRLAGGGDGLRVAHGWDSHPFGPGEGLRLGGILLEAAPRLEGHSDGDAVLHAVCDGLLAAAGLGDIGRLFPDDDPTTKDVESRLMLGAVSERLGRLGFRVRRVDVTVVAARPRLGAARLDAMAKAIAAVLGLGADRVTVKASSGNLSGDEGAGRVISASSVVAVSGA